MKMWTLRLSYWVGLGPKNSLFNSGSYGKIHKRTILLIITIGKQLRLNIDASEVARPQSSRIPLLFPNL